MNEYDRYLLTVPDTDMSASLKLKIENSIDLKNFKKIRREDCLLYEDFDKLYNVDTAHGLSVAKDGSEELVPGIVKNSDKYLGSNGFQNAALKQINFINDYLKNNIEDINTYTFIDLGSGSGRVILQSLITNSEYKKYIAVEIDTELHEKFLLNLKTCNVDKTNWPEVIALNEDILNYNPLNENTIYYIFAPFGPELFHKFLQKNNDVFKNNKTIIVEVGNCLPILYEMNNKSIPLLNGYNEIHKENLIHFYKSW